VHEILPAEKSMTIKTFKEAIIDGWDALIPLVGINLIWFTLTVLVLPAFPAMGGMYYATNRIAHGESATFRTFFEGFKEHFWTSWKWGFLNLAAYLLLGLNIWFYGQFEGWGFLILQSIFFSIMVIYTSIHFYTFPFLIEQDEPSLITAYRNSFAVFARFMGRSFGLLALFIALAVVSILLPPLWIVITVSAIIYLANWHTLYVIRILKSEEGKADNPPGS